MCVSGSSFFCGLQGDAEQLELAAAEMAQSAATLVQLERELEGLSADAAAEVRQAKVQSRMEAAAMLERKMAAMEAQLAARRITSEAGELEAAPPVEEKREISIPSKPPVHTSTGPAAGDGREIILQVCSKGPLLLSSSWDVWSWILFPHGNRTRCQSGGSLSHWLCFCALALQREDKVNIIAK